MKIVVILPTYNEKENITKMIPVLENEVFPKIKNHDMHILIADDHSPDGTGEIVQNFMKKWKNVELLEGNKEGLGAAYIRAMQYAMKHMHADAVIEFDADFQHDPHDIPRLIAAMDDGADYVIGSRYVKGGKIPKEWGLDRKIKSIFGSLFARIVLFTFSIHDMTSGFKLTKTSFLQKVDLDHQYSKNYAYKMQILYEVVKLGAKVKEVPIIFYERTQGKSKMDTNDLVESFMLVLRLRLRDSEKFGKFLVVGGFGFVMNFLVLKILSDNYGWNHASANLVGAALAIFSNFNFNNFWTFKAHRVSSGGLYLWKLLQFYATSAFGVIFIQTGTIFLGDRLIGEGKLPLMILNIPYYYIYFVIGTGLLLIWNFFIYSKFIWKHKPQ
jgi:dolichol-phosphate mannosyltransferase